MSERGGRFLVRGPNACDETIDKECEGNRIPGIVSAILGFRE